MANVSNEESLDYLIERGLDLNYVDDSGNNVLHFACAYDNLFLIDYLLKNGFDIESKNLNDATLLLLAACNAENPKTAEFLLDAGANLQAHDKENCNALINAAKNSSVEMLNYFIGKGFDLEEEDSDGWTALANATHWSDNCDIIYALRDAGQTWILEPSLEVHCRILLHLTRPQI